MKAGRRVAVRRKGEEGGKNGRIEYTIETCPSPEGSAAGEKDRDIVHDESEIQAKDTKALGTAAGPNPDDSSKAPKAEPNQQPASTTPKPTPSETPTPTPKSSTPLPLARNPLNWYGILVSPSLRQAQSYFTATVEGPIPTLLNILAQMAELETQIEDVRRVLGLGLDMHEKEEEEEKKVTAKEGKDETAVDARGEEAQVEEESTSLRSPKKHLRLAPRSRVLKLDN